MMELDTIRGAIVGVPGVTGLSVEQRKRLTIGVELVANPSVIFMDEPTSGLDARAAAIVMRCVKSIANTGRTIGAQLSGCAGAGPVSGRHPGRPAAWHASPAPVHRSCL